MKIKKTLRFGKESRKELMSGVEKVYKAVGCTLGFKGRNVVFNKPWGVVVTNDGVSIAEELELDGIEGIGAKMMIEAAQKTNNLVGDGTTTSIVLAYNMIKNGLKYVNRGFNPIKMREGIELAVDKAVDKLKDMAIETKDIGDIAKVSSGSSIIGNMLSQIFRKIGKDGAISIEDGQSKEISFEFIDGLMIPYGVIRAYFTQDGIEATQENVAILVSKRKIMMDELIPIVQALTLEKDVRLAVFATEFDEDAVRKMGKTHLQGLVKFLPIKIRDTNVLEDVASLVGADIAEHEPLKESKLGKATIKSNQNTTTIIGGDAKERIKFLNKLKPANELEKAQIRERIAKLSGGAAIIKIGAITDIELKEWKDKLEDAINASRAALEMGVVFGGGVSLNDCSRGSGTSDDPEIACGEMIALNAMKSPLEKIAENAGIHVNRVVGRVMTEHVFDPVKVTITALQNAASVAGSLLTTEASIFTMEVPDEGN